MRHHLLRVGVAMLLGPIAAAWAAEVGQPAPDFSLTDSTGTSRSLGDFKENFVVLEWFNNECPFVRKHYDSGNMQQLQAAYTAKGVVWLTMASSAPGKQGYMTPKQAQGVIRARGAHQTALLLDPDGAVGQRYGAKTTPHMFIINPDGVLIYAGAIDNIASVDQADLGRADNYVRRALDEALAGQPVSVAQTPSYGCSVKY